MCSGSNEICQALPLLFRHDEMKAFVQWRSQRGSHGAMAPSLKKQLGWWEEQ